MSCTLSWTIYFYILVFFLVIANNTDASIPLVSELLAESL